MKKIILLAMLLVPINTVFACGNYPVTSVTKQDGSKYGLFIPQEKMEKTQKWSPEDGEPQLPITQAYSLAKAWAATKYTRYDSVVIKEITLIQYGCSLVKNRWYYQVQITPVIDGNELWGGGNTTGVLMDGTIIGSVQY